MSLSYRVDVVFNSTGTIVPTGQFRQLNQNMNQAHGSANGIVDAFNTAGSSVDGLVTKLLAVVGALGLMSRALSVIKSGIGTNEKMETTKIGLAGEYESAGVVDRFDKGGDVADAAIRRMRQKAAALPGEFSDLVAIYNTAMLPMLRAGKTVKEGVDLAANAMAVGISRGIRPDVIGRELAAVLSGQAKGSNLLAARVLGLHGGEAARFNKQTASKRFDEVAGAFGSEGRLAAVDAYAKSFEGRWTTLVSNAKMTAMEMTKPLFNTMSNYLGAANQWFDNHQAEITHWVTSLGETLAKWFDRAAKSAENLIPYVKEAAKWLGLNAKNGNLELYGKRAVAGALGGEALDVGMSAGRSLLPMLSAIGAEGPAAALGLGLLATFAAALAVDVAGAASAINDASSPFHHFANLKWDEIKQGVGNLGQAFDQLSPKLLTVAEFFGVLFLENLSIAMSALLGVADALTTLAEKAKDFGDVVGIDLGRGKTNRRVKDEMIRDAAKYNDDGLLNLKGKFKPEDQKAKGHRTYINKVEIQVNSNQDPSRIARMTVQELNRLSERTLQSDKSMNWSRGSNAR